jgi:hypothetical protein
MAIASIVPILGATAGAARPGSANPVVRVSTCPGHNAEDEEAVSGPYAFVEWIGCGGIGFARSTDGGRTYRRAIELPHSQGQQCGPHGCRIHAWDPAVAVSRTGTVFAAFMYGSPLGGGSVSPVVEVLTNHGATVSAVHVLPSPVHVGNWGDRDFIAVGPSGDVLVTWDYGPSGSAVKVVCPPSGSCYFSNGDFNAVLQRSINAGRTWGPMRHVSPGFPTSGADLAPIVVQPNGTLDVLYQRMPTNPTTLAVSNGNIWFTRSTNHGVSWSTPVEIGQKAGTTSTTIWWIDGALSTDAAGNLYATWDTQTASTDVGWLSFSTNGGRSWSAPVAVTSPTGDVENLVESAGVARGIADVAWQTPTPSGYATFVRPYSITKGWLTSAPLRVSTAFGNPSIWPGDTFGIAASPVGAAGAHGRPVLLTWGSAVGTSPTTPSQIYSTIATP